MYRYLSHSGQIGVTAYVTDQSHRVTFWRWHLSGRSVTYSVTFVEPYDLQCNSQPFVEFDFRSPDLSIHLSLLESNALIIDSLLSPLSQEMSARPDEVPRAPRLVLALPAPWGVGIPRCDWPPGPPTLSLPPGPTLTDPHPPLIGRAGRHEGADVTRYIVAQGGACKTKEQEV